MVNGRSGLSDGSGIKSVRLDFKRKCYYFLQRILRTAKPWWPRDRKNSWRFSSSSQVFLKGAWEGGGWCVPLLVRPGRILSLRSSICWYFVNSWLLHIHPPTGFPEKKSQNILAEEANGSQMTEVKTKQNKKIKKFCNMLFESKNKLHTSLFCIFLIPFELSVLWNILLSTFSFITVEKVRPTGCAESLNKFRVFLFQIGCSQAIRSQRRWFEQQKMGHRQRPWETEIWRGSSG